MPRPISQRRRRSQAGLTLIEMLVVVTIIAITIPGSLPISGQRERAVVVGRLVITMPAVAALASRINWLCFQLIGCLML